MSIPWMPFYPADYLADTGHLTTQEHGAYLLLIFHYWSNGGLPDDDAKLARITRMTASEWTSVKDTIRDFFDGNWQHFRIDAELATARERHEARAAAGSKGGKRTQAKLKHGLSNAQATLNQPQPQPQPYSEPNGSDAGASAESRLWSEGVPMAIALGVPEKQARPMIGRWLKDCGNDHAALLRLIANARDQCPLDPIPWITASVKPRKGTNEKSVHAAIDRAVGYFEQLDKPAGAIRGGEGAGVVRLLPPGRRE